MYSFYVNVIVIGFFVIWFFYFVDKVIDKILNFKSLVSFE